VFGEGAGYSLLVRLGIGLLAGCVCFGSASASASGAATATYTRTVDEAGVVHVRAAPTAPRASWAEIGEGRGSGEAADDEAAYPLDDPRTQRYDRFIRGAAALYQIPEALLRALIHSESRYQPNARSPAGAIGLTQLMPATARFLGVTRPQDPRQNIYGGARFLRLLANRFNGDMVLVLAAYFAGAGAVQRYGGVPPYPGVRAYVKAVLRRYYAYERELQGIGEGAREARTIAG
jgi:soluble lytic murein transglycosylase-like protein